MGLSILAVCEATDIKGCDLLGAEARSINSRTRALILDNADTRKTTDK